MKFAAPFAAAALLVAPALAEERTFDVADFDRIDISAGVMLIANVGEEQSVVVKTEHGDFSDFEIEVSNGELSLSREWNRLSWHGKKGDYKVMISMPDLRSFEGSSGSQSKIFNVDSRQFSIDLSSGAFAEIAGECDACSLDLSSGANLDAKQLVCDRANIDVSSGGHGVLSVNDSVVADASSGGHVSVYGNPSRVNVDKSSGGKIAIKPVMAQASND